MNESAAPGQMAEVFFQSTPCLSAHVYVLKAHPNEYIEDLLFLCQCGAFSAVSNGTRACILAALHITSHHNAVTSVMKHCESTDIVKAATLLDRPRKLRQLKRKIQYIEDSNPNLVSNSTPESDGCDQNNTDANMETEEVGQRKPKRRRKIDSYRRQCSTIESELQETDQGEESSIAQNDTAVQELIQSSSVSGAFARKVKHWAKTCLTSDFLEHVMLVMPARPWQDLADLVHFNPRDFSVPYFLSDVHKDIRKKQSKESDKAKGDCVVGAPNDSFVSRMREMAENSDDAELDELFFRLAEDFPQTYLMYPFIRTQSYLMSRPRIVEDIASRMPLDMAMWYFEELQEASAMCESIIAERLKENGDITRSVKSKATYGKLVDRILRFRHNPDEERIQYMVTALGFSRAQAVVALRQFNGDMEQAAEWLFEDPGAVDAAVKRNMGTSQHQEGAEAERNSEMRLDLANQIIPIADSRLNELKEYWKKKSVLDDAKVAVFGDASESMQCAIEAATIFASMVSVCFDAELSFFSHKLVQSPHEKPTSVRETLEVCNTIRASGCTSLAAALWPYFEQKKNMDMFVLVTDEHENEPCNGYYFADLLAKYKSCVNENVSLVLVCVGKGDSGFRQSLTNQNIAFKAVYIDESRPDLAKFDALLGQLALVSSRCNNHCRQMHKMEANSDVDEEFVIVS